MSSLSPLKIVFAGTPDFAAVSLQAIINSPHLIQAVYTQPDRGSGRGRKQKLGPVKELALAAGIPVVQPVSLKGEEQQAQLAKFQPDVMVVVAYGLLLPLSILGTPRYGCINVHGSLLPRWRGAAPIQRAMIAGDKETGVTIMQMELGLDTGPMLRKVVTPISVDDTGATVHDRLAKLGAQALLECLDLLAQHQLEPIIQDDALATYADKLSKEEAEIDWSQSAELIATTIRAFNPWPVAYTQLDGNSFRIWNAHALDSTSDSPPGTVIDQSKKGIYVATGQGVLNMQSIQLPSKRAMSAADFVNANDIVGKKFS